MLRAAAIAAAALVLALLAMVVPDTPAERPPATEGTRSVLFVGNNWDGTVDVVDPVTFERLQRFNAVPDLQERLNAIFTDPVDLGYFLAIRQLVGEGNDQYVDDMFSSQDGRYVYISRPSLADVIGMDLQTKEIVWRFPMEGQRADHMGISPDGTRLLVSDSTANKVHELDTATGKKVGEFASGDSPHESNYSADGSRIFHASIGLVYTPADQPVLDSSKGERYFQIVEAGTNKILKRLDIGQIMAANGYEGYSSAVRPMAISPDEKTAYLQLSFLHGFVVFDLENDKPLRVVDLPVKGDGTGPREGYLLDSAHHGLAINPAGTKLCAAGTMSDYAAIVSTSDFTYKLIEPIDKPYWSTNSGDGKYCFISASGADEVVVVDYASEQEVARIPVGDHPQRMRMGNIRSEYVGGEPASVATPKTRPGLAVKRARVRGGRLELRLRRLERSARGKLRVAFRAGGERKAFRAKVPAKRAWTVRRRLPAALRGVRTGRVEVVLPASAGHAREAARLRVAPRRSRLRVKRAAIDAAGRIAVAGRVSRRARGRIVARISYVGDGSRARTLRFRAAIRRGKWSFSALLPSQARAGAQLSVRYGGRRAIGGEQLARRLRP